jgi:hypothetical protein
VCDYAGFHSALFGLLGKSNTQIDAWPAQPTGGCDIEVRGESHYPGNEHDRNAVKVYVERRLVGYLAAEEAEDYSECFSFCDKKKHAITYHAVIEGGGKKKSSLGIWLDLPTPA